MTTVIIPEADIWDEPCLAGKGALTCRYLVFGGVATGGWEFQCAKHDDVLKAQIDHNVEWGRMKAVGDNCEGKRP